MKIAIICCEEVAPLIAHLGDLFDHRRAHFHLYLSDFDAFIIQASVLVDTEKYSNWEGLELIERLRRDFRCQQPILMTSWRDDLLVGMQVCKSLERHSGRRIFLDPLVRFVPLSTLIPSRKKDLALYLDPPLDQKGDHMSFDELVRILYEHPPTYVRELFHRLYARLEQGPEKFQLQKAIDLVFDELIPLLKVFEGTSVNLIKQLEIFRANAGQLKGKSAFYSLLTELYDQLLAGISGNRVSPVESNPPEKQHILFIDDMIEDQEKLTKLLDPYHIIVHTAPDLITAKSYLVEYPSICTVLCDFRLYDQHGRIARQQGSQIMRLLQKEYPNLYFAYLSSYHFGQLDLRPSSSVELFHKHSIFSGEQPEFGRFIRRVFQKSEEKRSEMRYISLDLRKKPIGEQYLKFRYTDSFKARNQKISNQALEIFTDFQTRIYHKAGFGHRFQNKFLQEDVTGHEQENLDILCLQLLCRRVVIGLLQLPDHYFDQQLGSRPTATEKRQARFETIYNYLLGPHVKKGTLYKSKQDILNNCLGIKTGKTYQLSQFPQETRDLVFPEEWIWLQVNKENLTD
ncbi:hypothetical protein [Flavilitoribacter nigricans]|uniref:Response regulatory domain-containing protein n=1 Tax=Flavilitoribacter nigricans (strain ATCC 23147 / DSM 23189 / NBRC 102662 / NCIMB 1420 / SS-2) TaxID=1122177 RepID=A0A2D0NH01_FLAN2|nr:hypothetical protein [Flavilitoribacter nigricans]PHN07784.1 hypothetical protein CRP01_04495 [Flavilitoribacter nigricans DSM 23189 = NBRC 102662]